jgi:predicted secreted protein
MRQVLLLLAAFALMGGSTLAQSRDSVLEQGFSPDARYHLLITSNENDSNIPEARLQITDVQRNAIVYLKGQQWKQYGDEARNPPTLESLVTVWKQSQAAVLARYRLSTPAPGKRLFQVASRGDLGYPADTASQTTPLGVLHLTSRTLGSACRYNDIPTHGFTLKLGIQELQRDARLPGSRQCASAYDLGTAWQYKNALAVLVRVYSRGWEGTDTATLVVTTQLK